MANKKVKQVKAVYNRKITRQRLKNANGNNKIQKAWKRIQVKKFGGLKKYIKMRYRRHHSLSVEKLRFSFITRRGVAGIMDKVIGIICILVAVGAAFYGGRNYEKAKRQAELAKSMIRIQRRKHFNGRS